MARNNPLFYNDSMDSYETVQGKATFPNCRLLNDQCHVTRGDVRLE